MALFYRGAGPGSYWHTNDGRLKGFSPHNPGGNPSSDCIINHIARGSTNSPYISLTRSYAVARSYALAGPAGYASVSTPGYVYEIEVSDDKKAKVLDPVVEIAQDLPKPWTSPCYQHDGKQSFLLGIIDPVNNLHHVQEHILTPPGTFGTPRAATLSSELEALVRALRDAEVLVMGNVPTALFRSRYDIF